MLTATKTDRRGQGTAESRIRVPDSGPLESSNPGTSTAQCVLWPQRPLSDSAWLQCRRMIQFGNAKSRRRARSAGEAIQTRSGGWSRIRSSSRVLLTGTDGGRNKRKKVLIPKMCHEGTKSRNGRAELHLMSSHAGCRELRQPRRPKGQAGQPFSCSSCFRGSIPESGTTNKTEGGEDEK